MTSGEGRDERPCDACGHPVWEHGAGRSFACRYDDCWCDPVESDRGTPREPKLVEVEDLKGLVGHFFEGFWIVLWVPPYLDPPQVVTRAHLLLGDHSGDGTLARWMRAAADEVGSWRLWPPAPAAASPLGEETAT